MLPWAFLCYSLLAFRSLVQVSDWVGVIADGLVYGCLQPPTGSPRRCFYKGSAHCVSHSENWSGFVNTKGTISQWKVLLLLLVLGCKILESSLMFDGA